MAKKTNWLPTSRSGIITMALNWIAVLTTEKRTAWGIPAAEFTEFGLLMDTARTLLQKATSDTERTPVVTAQCNTAFEALRDKMRFFKKHYFLVPPLEDADLVSLGLKIPDPTHTPTGKPTAEVTVEPYLAGRHQLGIRLLYITGTPDDPANKGYRVWYSVVGEGETPPANPEELRKSFYTKRKKDLIDFDFGDSGKTVWLAVQVENDGKKGPWGPLTSALIP